MNTRLTYTSGASSPEADAAFEAALAAARGGPDRLLVLVAPAPVGIAWAAWGGCRGSARPVRDLTVP